MKARISSALALPAVVAVTLAAAGSAGAATRSAAPSQDGAVPSYRLVVLGSLGGTLSSGNSINDQGIVTGSSNLPGNEATVATLWRGGSPVSLGTLGGADSAVEWPQKATDGYVYGIAETATVNPSGEAWSCSAFFPTTTYHECEAFVWHDGVMRALPSFGGPDGFAAGSNSRGQVVGWAEDTYHDPTCVSPQVYQFRAALWNGHTGALTELPPLAGDATSAATDINDRGVAVGISGSCDVAVGAYSAAHVVKWVDGAPVELPTLGAPAWNTPNAINGRGEVVGFVNQAGTEGDAFDPVAVDWAPSGALHVLGVLPGGALSEALGLNTAGEVVGQSCTASFTCSGFVVDGGQMYDLQDLVTGAPGIQITSANDVNNRGQITGQAYDPATGASVTFLATPTGGDPQPLPALRHGRSAPAVRRSGS
jgi:uncharacterized membrane protein